ncbi:hypothetical protein AVDCRST_MAG84-387 [uncultured Microcoleus sp.]|uniref:Uncharacterized protein n=1 Tax=uncultured Microcoleus sp. TaxID=259945 RepID=A0A6J4KGA6_9CYAN|nr:hypothetical protein AVDCRST_MAG84-387 [uncultured Microcoleus sp.]
MEISSNPSPYRRGALICVFHFPTGASNQTITQDFFKL